MSHVPRKTYCDGRFRSLDVQSIAGRRRSGGRYPIRYTAMSSSDGGTRSSPSISSHAPGVSIGNDTNWMPRPSSVVASQMFSIAAPMLNTE